jgi:ribosomal protection tetracycline resistance protein
MHKTIGMFAHVDAGKTTFAEQLLYTTKAIRQRGRVDSQDAFMDSHEIEKERGITVFADQASFSFAGNEYDLIDTPGHVDFSPEMERAIQVMDYAVVLVSAVEGVQSHTETVWQLLRSYRIPTFFFINKIDRIGADVESVLADIRINLTDDVCDLTKSLAKDRMEEELIAAIAERDEQFLERYIDQSFSYDEWLDGLRTLIRSGRLFPCMQGSALQDIGIREFLEKFDLLTTTDYSETGPFAGRVYKLRHEDNGNKITYMKALSGSLCVRDEVSYGDGRTKKEKVTQIRLYNGRKFKIVERVSAGQLFAVTGLTEAGIGDGVGALEDRTASAIVPALQSKAIFESTLPVKDVLRCFKLLDAEDPSLHVSWNEYLQEIHILVMGTIQLEVLQRVMRERFHFDVAFGAPQILYKETIADTVTGCGHFEPLGHYAEVHLRLESGERNSGIVFENECHPDELPTNFQNLIEQHIFERQHNGLLTGSPLTDVKITLLKGRAHNKHTSGGDFREATFRSLRQGLEKAKNILLEPFYDFKIKVEVDHLGRVLSDIQQAYGRFQPPDIIGNKASISGRAPVATFLNYSAELAALSQGRGVLQLKFGGYERCHNEQEIIAAKQYHKHADPLYTSASIFCSKGQAYSVPWDEAESQMHC